MRIESGKSLEVAAAAATAQQWLERLDAEGIEVEFDATSLERMDSAGAQLVLGLRAEALRRAGTFQLVGASPEFHRVFARLGLPAEANAVR